MNIISFLRNKLTKKKRGGKKKKKNKKTSKEKSTPKLTSLEKKIKEYTKAMQTYKDIQGEISYLYRHYDYTSDPEVQQSILREIKKKTRPADEATEKLLQATMEYENLVRSRSRPL